MRNLKRALSLALASVMLFGMMVVGTSAASYPDVTDAQNVEAIEVLQKIGVMSGDEKGNFNPDKRLTRAEMAVIMCHLLDYTVASYKGTSPFADVPAGHWAEEYVAACYTNKIISGYSATTFGVDDALTTGQAALMILKALGYFQEQGDFGADWLVETVRIGANIGLFDGVDKAARDAVTRNDAAQLCLNALQADMVRIGRHDLSAVNGDLTTKAVYEARTGTDAAYTAIDGTLIPAIIGQPSIQLGEELYDGDLERTNPADDAGRPSTTWSYQSSEIGSYPDTPRKSWTGTVTEKDLYNAAGSAAYESYTWDVFRDGTAVFAGAAGNVVIPTSKNSTERWQQTGNGVLTELYVDVARTNVTVVMSNTYVGKVTKCVETDDGYEVTVAYPTGRPAGRGNTFDSDVAYNKDDIVIMTIGLNDIMTMAKPETADGEVTAFKGGDYVILDGTKYDYNRGYTGGAPRILGDLADLDNGGAAAVFGNGNKVTLYMDAYGYPVAVEGAEDVIEDYLFVRDAAVDFTSDVRAKVTFSDGSRATVDIDDLDYTDVTGVVGKPTPGANPLTIGEIYRYSVDSSDTYDLERVATVRSYTMQTFNGTQTITRKDATIPTTGAGCVADGDTIYVDAGNGKVWTGYRNVPTLTTVTGAVLVDNGKAKIVYVSQFTGNTAIDNDYILVKGKDPEETRIDGQNRWNFTDTWNMDGEQITTTTTNNNYFWQGGVGTAATSRGLWMITSRDTDDYVNGTNNTGVATAANNGFFLPTTINGLGDSMGANALLTTYATQASAGIITVNDNGNNDVNLQGKLSFQYDDNTKFLVAELKRGTVDGEISSVYAGSVSDIEVAEAPGDRDQYTTAVYVVSVEDANDATPLAEIVFVVKADI